MIFASPSKPLPKTRKLVQPAEDNQDPFRYINPAIPTNWPDFARLCQIQSGGTVKPFIPYDFQIELVQEIEQGQNIVICKSRQIGISECICCYLLMRAVTEPGFAAVVFSKTQDDSSLLGQRIRDMAVSLGSLCPEMTSDSKTKVFFRGLGRLYFLPVTARSARGVPSVSCLLMDEAGFIDGIDGVYQAAVPALSMLGDRAKIILNSTPNGKNNLFYRLLSGGSGEARCLLDACAKMKRANWVEAGPERLKRFTQIWTHQKWTKVLLHYKCHPIYGADPDWAQKTREERKLTESDWNQEYELGFAENNLSVFSDDLLDQAIAGQWEPCTYGRVYAAGIDPNEGGEDYYCCRIWDVTEAPYKLVAQYRRHRELSDLNVSRTMALLNSYRRSLGLVVVEAQAAGDMHLMEFTRLLPDIRVEKTTVSNQSKIQTTNTLVLLLERSQLVFPTEDDPENNPTTTEYRHFIETRTARGLRRREAESGWHDDTVMADAALFAWLDDFPAPFTATAAAAPIRRLDPTLDISSDARGVARGL